MTDFLDVGETCVFRSLAPRVKTQDWLRLLDEPIGLTADETGGHVHELRFEALGQSDQVFDSVHVGAERVVHGREELDATGAVDDDSDSPRQLFEVSRVKHAIGLADVARPNGNFVLKGVLAALAGDSLDGGRLKDFGLKSFRGRKILLGANEDVEAFELRVAVQNESQQDLAQEAVRPRHEDFVLTELFSDVNQVRLPV